MKPLSDRLIEHADAHAHISPYDAQQEEWEASLREAANLVRQIEDSAIFVTLTWNDFNRGLSLDSEEIESSLTGKRVAIIPMPEEE